MASSSSSWWLQIQRQKWSQFERHSIVNMRWSVWVWERKQYWPRIVSGTDQKLKLQNLSLATVTGPAVRNEPKNTTADVQYAIYKCESLGSGKQLILHGNPSAPHMAVIRRHFFAECAPPPLYVTSGQIRLRFWHLCCQRWSHSLGTPLENPFKINWREGFCTPIQFFSTAFDPRAWTMVVFWKESLGRQLQLMTPENEEGDNTNYPCPPSKTFFDDPEVPFGPQGPRPPEPPEPHEPPGSPGTTRMASSSTSCWW